MPKTLLCFLLLVCFVASATAQKSPDADLYTGFSYLSADTNGLTSRLSAYGWETSASFNIYRHFAIEGDVSQHYYDLKVLNDSIFVVDSAFAGGPRVNFGPLFFHSLFGGDILATRGASQGGFILIEGGGVQIPVSGHWAARVSADYGLSRHNVFGGVRYDQNNFRAGVGVVYHFGGAKGQEPSQNPGNQPPLNMNYAGPKVTLADIGVTGLWNTYGFYVRAVAPGSPAEKAGIVSGDTIVRVGGHTVESEDQATAALSQAGGAADVGITKESWNNNQVAIRHVELQVKQ